MKQKIAQILEAEYFLSDAVIAGKILKLVKKEILKAGYDKMSGTYSPDDIFEYVKKL